MPSTYTGFLAVRATQRRLAAQFADPRRLLLHALAFVVAMTAIWVYGSAWGLWHYQINYGLPVIVGAVWSLILAVHAGFHYRRSAARDDRVERAVENAMRQLIDADAAPDDDHALFDMHNSLQADLEHQGRHSRALLAFALVNVVSWVISAINMGTSWGFQMTLPLAVMIIGGVPLFLDWQARQQAERKNWFARLPLRHMIAYGVGIIGLWLAGAARMIHPWDADTILKYWSILLPLHIIWSVVVQPVAQKFMLRQAQAAPTEKYKPEARLLLADDGEVFEIADSEQDAVPVYRRHGL